jgi:hypothetical protein
VKDRSMGVVIPCTESGGGSSSEIASCAKLGEIVPNSNADTAASMNKQPADKNFARPGI